MKLNKHHCQQMIRLLSGTLLSMVIALSFWSNGYAVSPVIFVKSTPKVETSPKPQMQLKFRVHVEDNLPEQDVFIERDSTSGQVFRPTAAERDMTKPLFASTQTIRHDPFRDDALGPWPKGRELGVTLGEWLKADGIGSYRCEGGTGNLTVDFRGLIPHGLYTMWHYFMASPPTEPFIGTYDLPVGARDGSQSAFRADASGNGHFNKSFAPCLQLSGEHLSAGLAIAWHSDGRVHGVEPGDFALNSHVQLYVGLPRREDL